MFVELDAFYALATDAARNLIRSNVVYFFNDEIHEETREEEKEMKQKIYDLVREQVTFEEE